jgi:uncharacterized protein (TIGR02246 family)
MNIPSLVTAAVLISTAAPISAWAMPMTQTARTCPVATTAHIEAQFERFSDAWATRDPDVVTALFTDEPVQLPSVSNTPRTSPAGVRDYFVSLRRNQPVARIDTSTIEVDCLTASRVGTWTVTLTDAATGQTRDVHARYSFIYRFEDGVWKIDHLHSSMTPEPAPAHTR